jgi:NAD(P)-dependent dehydrogenase (short-subunit alcohol dehydrogenase family)
MTDEGFGQAARYPSLKGRVALITGGAMGIGEAIVRAFAAQGTKIGFLDIADEAARQLQADLGTTAAVHYEHCDVTDIAALQRAIEKVRHALGPITILINNAAHDQRHKIDDITPAFWDERIATNLKHQFFAAQAVYPDMKAANNGSIVNFGSSAYLVGDKELLVYSTAKAGVVGLTRSLARDLGEANIRVNAVIPGWIMTRRQLELWLTPQAEKDLMQRQCIKRKLYPDDVARLVLFLASDDASGCTSQSYVIDGGRW